MATRRPLALSDDQLAIVMDHATLVQPRWRQHYLRAVADVLEPLRNGLDDSDVAAAASLVLSRHGLERRMSKRRPGHAEVDAISPPRRDREPLLRRRPILKRRDDGSYQPEPKPKPSEPKRREPNPNLLTGPRAGGDCAIQMRSSAATRAAAKARPITSPR